MDGLKTLYIHTIKAWRWSVNLKGKRLWGLSEKLAQQETDYATKGIHFANLPCTNSNKGAWQHAGN